MLHATWTCGRCGHEWTEEVRDPDLGESVTVDTACPNCEHPFEATITTTKADGVTTR